jgi:hypothetical protein
MGYELDGQSSVPDRGKKSFSTNVQTSFGAYSASYPMATTAAIFFLNGSTALVVPRLFFSFLIYSQSAGLLE